MFVRESQRVQYPDIAHSCEQRPQELAHGHIALK